LPNRSHRNDGAYEDERAKARPLGRSLPTAYYESQFLAPINYDFRNLFYL